MIGITGIAGSPRKNGNSSTLLRHVLTGAGTEGAESVETIYANDLRFSGCQNCGACIKTARCALKDDMSDVYDKLDNSDIWVFSTSVFYDNLTGQLKLFFDRLRPFSKSKENKHRKRAGAFIIVYEDRYRADYAAMARVYEKYLPWFGNFIYTDILEIPEMKNVGDILNSPDLLYKAEEFGRNLVVKLKTV